MVKDRAHLAPERSRNGRPVCHNSALREGLIVLPEKLLEKINELVETYAKAHTCRTLASMANHEAEAAHLNARADFWDAQVSNQYAKLTVAVNSAVPPTVYATCDPHATVRIPDGHAVEVYGTLDHGQRAVSITFTGVQAMAVGTAMIACAALSSGGRLAQMLPPVPASEPEQRRSA
ncbi:hypothetical protein GCM10009557_01310 [Virgisporangium ochraceum]|uniref:Uncharacterized protein n=1 Tax=Virgisporangium ochraceum TaxID=65505 RepID=A0A8J4A1P9_9ACTN|nr:hypothetical protein [Virgisporangium ochraceum]GIJ74162.1 hypothetical protein Voc01_090790 [Virgisporangium ochraceum]